MLARMRPPGVNLHHTTPQNIVAAFVPLLLSMQFCTILGTYILPGADPRSQPEGPWPTHLEEGKAAQVTALDLAHMHGYL